MTDKQFCLGCAVWSYRGWVNDFFPAGSQPKDFLQLYSQRLTAVEGNTTFYAVPTAKAVQRWCLDTPPDFQFCLKLPRELTHQGALTAAIPGALSFLERVQPLASRLGPIFAQLPPTYGPESLADLADFLQQWPRADFPLAVEVRHRQWFVEPYRQQLQQLLTQLGVGRVLLDTRPIYQAADNPQVHSERKKPNLPLQPVVTAPFSIIRFISHPDAEQNQAYLQQWVEQISAWLAAGTRLYFFVHCPIEERSPNTARSFQHQLEREGVPVPALPWDSLQQPEQLSLFG